MAFKTMYYINYSEYVSFDEFTGKLDEFSYYIYPFLPDSKIEDENGMVTYSRSGSMPSGSMDMFGNMPSINYTQSHKATELYDSEQDAQAASKILEQKYYEDAKELREQND